MEKNVTLFFRKTNPEFSNFYIAPFEICGTVYPSVEHYFMTRKAEIFDPEGDAIKKMNNDCTPAQMKKLGRQVKNFNPERWEEESRKIMFHAVYQKFFQNPELKEKLLSTGYSIIAEASPFDKKWGIGISESHENAYCPEKWTGRNLLGEILMLVRGILRYSQDGLQFIVNNPPDLEKEGCSRMNCFYDLEDDENPILSKSFWLRYTQFRSTTADELYDKWIKEICGTLGAENCDDFMYTLNMSFEMLSTDQANANHNDIFLLVHTLYRSNDRWSKIFVGDIIE